MNSQLLAMYASDSVRQSIKTLQNALPEYQGDSAAYILATLDDLKRDYAEIIRIINTPQINL